MIIRIAEKGDAPSICRGEWETAATPGLLVGRPGEIPLSAFEGKIVALAPQGSYWVVVEDGVIAGHSFLEAMGMRGTAHVFSLNIVIHPGFTDRGYGKALMTRMLEWARQNERLEKIELLVRAVNSRAIGLYKKFGFIEEGRFKNRIKTRDGSYLDDIAMAWFPVRDSNGAIG